MTFCGKDLKPIPNTHPEDIALTDEVVRSLLEGKTLQETRREERMKTIRQNKKNQKNVQKNSFIEFFPKKHLDYLLSYFICFNIDISGLKLDFIQLISKIYERGSQITGIDEPDHIPG
jgi:hypothetical protein